MSREHCASSVGQAQVYRGAVKGLWPTTLILVTPSHVTGPSYGYEDKDTMWLPPSRRSAQYLSSHLSSTTALREATLNFCLKGCKRRKQKILQTFFFSYSLHGWMHRADLQMFWESLLNFSSVSRNGVQCGVTTVHKAQLYKCFPVQGAPWF